MPSTIAISERPALRLAEAALYSGLSRPTLFRLIRAGSIASRKVGRARMIDRRSLDALLTGKTA